MKLLGQSSNKFAARHPQSFTGTIAGLIAGVAFLGAGLVPIVELFFSEAESLTCKRIEVTQINCELTKSSFYGLVENEKTVVTNVNKVRVERESDRENKTLYRIFLSSKNAQLSLPQYGYEEVQRIDKFFKNSENTLLKLGSDVGIIKTENTAVFLGSTILVLLVLSIKLVLELSCLVLGIALISGVITGINHQKN